MNPYIVPVVCELCGGEGVAHAGESSSYSWGVGHYHKDPEVCRWNLEKERRRAELKKKQTQEQLEGSGI